MKKYLGLSLLFLAGSLKAATYGPYIHSQSTLQAGTTFYVSSGTVAGNLNIGNGIRWPDGSFQTTVSSGIGNAVLGATQTWSGTNSYLASGAAGLSVTGLVPTNTGARQGTVVIDKTLNTNGAGLQIYTAAQQDTALDGLLFLYSDATSYQEPMLYILDKSSGSNGANAEIRLDSNNVDIEMVNTNLVNSGVNAKYEIAIPQNADYLQINGRNAANSSFQNIARFYRQGGTSGSAGNLGSNALYIGTTGYLLLGDAIDNHYVGFMAPQSVTNNTIWTLPNGDGTTGQVLTTNGSKVLSFSNAGSGDVVKAATQTFSGINTMLGSLNMVNTSTNTAFKVTDNGNKSNGDFGQASMFVDGSNNGGGLTGWFYSNFGAGANTPIFQVQNDNSAYNNYIMEIRAAATSFAATTLEMQAPIPSIEFRGNLSVPPVDEFQISEKNDTMRLEGRKSDNSGFDSMIVLQRPTTGVLNAGGGVGINPNGGYTNPINALDVGGAVSIGSSLYGISTAPVSGLLVQGNVVGQAGIAPAAETVAQLNALTPSQAGLMYYCSNCSVDGIVVSTGTNKGAFARISARTTPYQ